MTKILNHQVAKQKKTNKESWPGQFQARSSGQKSQDAEQTFKVNCGNFSVKIKSGLEFTIYLPGIFTKIQESKAMGKLGN